MVRLLALILSGSLMLAAADPVDAVREVAEGWYQAAVKQDAAALNRYLSDDLSYCHAGGKVQTKAEYIAGVMNWPYPSHVSATNNRARKIL